MIYMLDRSALVHLMTVPESAMRKRMSAVQESGNSLAMSAITLAELETTAARLGDSAEMRRVLNQLTKAVEVLDWPTAAAAVLGRMSFPDTQMSVVARQVAAHALTAGAVLVFASPALPPEISGLPAEDWTRAVALANPG